MTDYKPLEDRVIVEQIAPDNTTLSGIHLPFPEQGQTAEGRVVAVGPGRWSEDRWIPLDVMIGDRVLYDRYAAFPITHDGQQLSVLTQGRILAVLEEGV